jgi:hypothetical protein
MRSIAVIILLAAVASAAVAGPEALAREPGALPLERRACANTGCKCRKDGNNLQQGQYCGNCIWTSTGQYIISAKRVDNHIYECNPEGGCCDYGVSDCAGKANQCPRA